MMSLSLVQGKKIYRMRIFFKAQEECIKRILPKFVTNKKLYEDYIEKFLNKLNFNVEIFEIMENICYEVEMKELEESKQSSLDFFVEKMSPIIESEISGYFQRCYSREIFNKIIDEKEHRE